MGKTAKINTVIITVTVLVIAAIGFCLWWFCFREDKSTGISLASDDVLKYGSRGKDVETLQAMLNSKYNAGLDVDGIWGEKTQAAVLENLGKSSISTKDIYTL